MATRLSRGLNEPCGVICLRWAIRHRVDGSKGDLERFDAQRGWRAEVVFRPGRDGRQCNRRAVCAVASAPTSAIRDWRVTPRDRLQIFDGRQLRAPKRLTFFFVKLVAQRINHHVSKLQQRILSGSTDSWRKLKH